MPSESPETTVHDTAPSHQLRCDVERITFRNDDNGWTVLKGRDMRSDQEVTAVGHFASAHAGASFELFGEWIRHPKFGRQFKVERCVELRPSTTEGIEKYLASGVVPGIGPKTATKIVKHFGSQTLDVLDESPERLREVPTIGKKKAQTMIEAWRGQRGIADVMMFLNQHGVSSLFAGKIYKRYGSDAIDVVSADPYCLATDIHGIGFLSADKIARSMGIPENSPERLRAALIYQIKQGEDQGHCYLTSHQIVGLLEKLLRLSEDEILGMLADAMAALTSTGAMISEDIDSPDGTNVRAHYRADLYFAEDNFASGLRRLAAQPLKVERERIAAWLSRYGDAAGTALSEEQCQAVIAAASHRVFVLTGGPGVGKTTTANAIIRLFKAMGRSVALAAPTGRAAQRLSEVAATSARTIHRLLEWVPAMSVFARNEDNPLTSQVVIVDEASMIDIRIADALIRAVPETAQLIFIGDSDQLPSVGPGNVLRDMIQSGEIQACRLREIFRQAATSQIVRAAHQINQGSALNVDLSEASDCRFIENETASEIKETIKNLLTTELAQSYDPFRDVQVLTPMNRGELGTQSLNAELQQLLNPAIPGQREYQRGQIILRQGDKVIQSSNNYELSVFNGDIGTIAQTQVEGGELLVDFSGRIVRYNAENALDLRLAYAITIHKSQGSEFPVVLIPCSMQHYVMLQRNLMYTALTRAKKLAIFIGARKALDFAIGNQSSAQRQTNLITRMRTPR